MTTTLKPTHTLRCGNIKATIWQNASEKSHILRNLLAAVKDQSGAWHNGTSFRAQ